MKTMMEPMPVTRKEAAAGLRAFFHLGDVWKLSAEQQIVLLGRPARSTFFEWKKHPERDLQPDTIERLSYLMGIYKALQIIFSDPTIADQWIHQPAEVPPFAGKTPLQYMLRGDMVALYDVRRYLDAQRGAW